MKLPPKAHYPKEVLIGDETYQVKFVSRIESSSTVGECDDDKKVLRIVAKQSAADTFATFIHEVIHAMEHEYGIKINHSTVYKLETAISDFILQNF